MSLGNDWCWAGVAEARWNRTFNEHPVVIFVGKDGDLDPSAW